MVTQKAMLVGKEKAASFLAGSTIEIRVGKNGQSFYVHKDLLTSRSRFFAKALKGYKITSDTGSDSDSVDTIQWKEGEEGVLELPDDEADVFEAYTQLIYYDRLPICDSLRKADLPTTATEDDKTNAAKQLKTAIHVAVCSEYELLGKLYVFCEKIRDVSAKQALLSAFVEASTKVRGDGRIYYPGSVTVRIVYAGTVKTDVIREWMTDCYVIGGCEEWTGTKSSSFPQEFLFDVMVGMYIMRAPPTDRTRMWDVDYYCQKLQVSRGEDAEGPERSDSGM